MYAHLTVAGVCEIYHSLLYVLGNFPVLHPVHGLINFCFKLLQHTTETDTTAACDSLEDLGDFPQGTVKLACK